MLYFFLILLILLLILFVGCYFIFRKLVWRRVPKAPGKLARLLIKGGADSPEFERDQPAAMRNLNALPLEKIALTAKDGATLRGHLLEPAAANDRVIIACHGMGSTGCGEFCFFAPDFYKKGYTILLPDHRGCGESDGDFMGFGTHESRDTFLWVQYAKKRYPDRHIFLLGVSMGAATVLMMSGRPGIRDVSGIIADCAYTNAWDEFSYQLKSSFHLPDFPALYLCDMYCQMICNYSFKQASPIDAVKKAKAPVLFIHGAEDALVPPYMQGLLYDACASEKYSLKIEGATHARSYYTNPELYTKAVEAFMTQTLRPKTLRIPQYE
ncbi:MAG: alpha/beta fold hydrolase [Clostridia bacterium]|nr:alpha/beta fold hydrolase [Clostridia bacterium]